MLIKGINKFIFLEIVSHMLPIVLFKYLLYKFIVNDIDNGKLRNHFRSSYLIS